MKLGMVYDIVLPCFTHIIWLTLHTGLLRGYKMVFEGVLDAIDTGTHSPTSQLHPLKPAEKHCKEQRVAIKHENALGA